MKKIEKDLLLKDLDYVYNEVELKKDKLNSIMSLFMDEEPEIIKKSVEEKIKETEKKSKKLEEDELKEKEKVESEEEKVEEEIIKDNTSEHRIDLPKDIKTLYRKIVMMIHPDKNKNKSNTELYTTLYKRIIEAKNNNDKADILYVAYKLNIKEVYDIEDDHFGSIKKKIKEKEMESNNLKYNSFWVWYHTDNKKLKKVMSNQIVSSMKKK
ncbi:MAG: hypothetical protein ACOC3V_05260 [bacterium]